MKSNKNSILKEFNKRNVVGISILENSLGISRQAIHRHLDTLIREGTILRQGSGKRNTTYILNTAAARKKIHGKKRIFSKRVRIVNLAEDRLLAEVEAQPGLLSGLSASALSIFRFAFTEMVNNAIDHSGSARADVDVSSDRASVSFCIADKGVGLFENIRAKKSLVDEMEAIQDLLKGKTTTAPEAHSGEGIFFTSKIADSLVLESHRKRLTVDNLIEDVFVEDCRFRKGTHVSFRIGAQSSKDLTKIFHDYTGEEFQFDKSSIAVKLFASGDAYISRSQAKRLLHSMESFRKIELDFSGVPTVGQAFADEIFRVFRMAHPDMEITVTNCSENCDFMIRRAKATQLF